MRAVHLVVERIAVLVGKVRPVDVVHVAVAVVVQAVAGDLAGVVPHVLAQVLMRVVDARVDDGHDDAGAELAGEASPGLWAVDVLVALAVHAPEGREVGVVGDALAGAAHAGHHEELPGPGLLTVGTQRSILLCHEELSVGGLQGYGPIRVGDQREPLPATNQVPVCADLSVGISRDILAEVTLQGDGSIIVVEDLKFRRLVHVVPVALDSTALLSRSVLAMEALERHQILRGRPVAASQHEAVVRRAAVPHQSQGRTAGLCLALPHVLEGPRPRLLLAPVGEVHPGVRRGELHGGVLLELPHEPLLRLLRLALRHGQAHVREALRLQHPGPRRELPDPPLEAAGLPGKVHDDPVLRGRRGRRTRQQQGQQAQQAQGRERHRGALRPGRAAFGLEGP
mmetsp:Transcript_42002/g.121518  ORF Transcript_42002/g.121518 Transcript_42002/m.121518 type:complete len:397 (+) Transcript_42002:787-1977(+)